MIEDLLIPGFVSQEESIAALARTTPELALLALMQQSSEAQFICIGRDADGAPTAIVVDSQDFLSWLESPRPRRLSS